MKESARSWTEAEARAEIDRHRERLDPVEGLWYSRAGRFAVLHEPGAPAGTFVAVRLAKEGQPSKEIAAVLRRIARPLGVGCGMPHPDHLPLDRSAALSGLVQAGLLTGVSDGLFATVSAVLFGSTVTLLWQSVASTLLGPAAFERGTESALIGVLMHFGVAFGWSAVFLGLLALWPRLRALLASPYGAVKVAAVYGPFIWLVMSLVVIPLLVQRPPTITSRWLIQWIGHFPFVGLPIAWSFARSLRARSPR